MEKIFETTPKVIDFYFDMLYKFTYEFEEETESMKISEQMRNAAFHGIDPDTRYACLEFFTEFGLEMRLSEEIKLHIEPKLHDHQEPQEYLEAMLFNFASEFDFLQIDAFTYEHVKDVMLQYAFNY